MSIVEDKFEEIYIEDLVIAMNTISNIWTGLLKSIIQLRNDTVPNNLDIPAWEESVKKDTRIDIKILYKEFKNIESLIERVGKSLVYVSKSDITKILKYTQGENNV